MPEPAIIARTAYLTPGEVAVLLRVDPKTVTRWCITGKLPSIRTPGGHHRIPAPAVEAYLTTPGNPPPQA